MSNIKQLTTNLSDRILTSSQLKNTKGKGRGIHADGTPGMNGKGGANGHSTAMSKFHDKGKCPPPFEIDSVVIPDPVFFV